MSHMQLLLLTTNPSQQIMIHRMNICHLSVPQFHNTKEDFFGKININN